MVEIHTTSVIREDICISDIPKADRSLSVQLSTTEEHIDASNQESLLFHIEKRLISPATIVLKAIEVSKDNTYKKGKCYCIKLWRHLKNDIYDTSDTDKNNTYTLEGLEFNQNFASGVYIGIAPVLPPFEQNSQRIELGPMLIPSRENLRHDRPHALIMNYLEQNLRLDNQLKSNSFGNEDDMGFLASELIRMQHQMVEAPHDYKSYHKLCEKWELNKRHLIKAFSRLLLPKLNENCIKKVFTTMDNALQEYKDVFEERCQHVKHCHGDLKTNNLWLLPEEANETNSQLNALDCIDFNPLFSYIDPLSDAAMLAMDLEMQLSLKESLDIEEARRLTGVFLHKYMAHYHGIKGAIEPIMEFYIAEKAIVCTYVSILSDHQPAQGLRYWQIAQHHIQKLAHLLVLRKRPIIREENFQQMI